jgi:hypothetical protein
MKTSELRELLNRLGEMFRETENHFISAGWSISKDSYSMRFSEGTPPYVVQGLIDYVITPISQREPRVKQHTFTEFEKEFLNAYKDYPYIVRAKNGDILFSKTHPVKDENYWFYTMSITIPRFNDKFQSVQWEDEEPCEWGKWV